MTDNERELLALAAMAAGYTVRFTNDGFGFRCDKEWTGGWNPLTDDGDALRLAVKLDILSCSEFWRERSVQYAMDAMNGDRQDPYASTRRAIVRAAAEIGKRLTGE